MVEESDEGIREDEEGKVEESDEGIRGEVDESDV